MLQFFRQHISFPFCVNTLYKNSDCARPVKAFPRAHLLFHKLPLPRSVIKHRCLKDNGEGNASPPLSRAIWVCEWGMDALTDWREAGVSNQSPARRGCTRAESSWKILCARLVRYRTRTVLTNTLPSDVTIAARCSVLVPAWKVDTHTFWSILVRHSRRRTVTWSWVSEGAQIQIWVNSVPLSQRNRYYLLYHRHILYKNVMAVPESDFSSWGLRTIAGFCSSHHHSHVR